DSEGGFDGVLETLSVAKIGRVPDAREARSRSLRGKRRELAIEIGADRRVGRRIQTARVIGFAPGYRRINVEPGQLLEGIPELRHEIAPPNAPVVRHHIVLNLLVSEISHVAGCGEVEG